MRCTPPSVTRTNSGYDQPVRKPALRVGLGLTPDDRSPPRRAPRIAQTAEMALEVLPDQGAEFRPVEDSLLALKKIGRRATRKRAATSLKAVVLVANT